MNRLYSRNRKKFLDGTFDWPVRSFIMSACRGAYTFDEDHQIDSEIIAAGGVIVTDGLPLTGMTAMAGGYAMSNLTLIPAVPAGAPITFLILFDVTDLATTGKVPLVYIDEAMGLPFTPNGLDQNIQPDWLSHRGWFRA